MNANKPDRERSGDVIPFRRPVVEVTPGSAAAAALDWLSGRVTWRAPAAPAETIEADEFELLASAAAGVHLQPVEGRMVMVRQFDDGTQDAVLGTLDEDGTFTETRRIALGRGELLTKTDRLRAVIALAVASI